jgi:hypothetical protein
MAADQTYEIRELSDESRTRSGHRYRNHLTYVAQLAIWIGNIYVVIRVLAILLSPQKWQNWAMFLVEAVFICEYHCHPNMREVPSFNQLFRSISKRSALGHCGVQSQRELPT